jgi:4-amino-4-deoxy-L-arabinose transferase-like glycosyltransferase
VIGLLLGTAGLYLWGLDRSGWANAFYSAAVQAGTKSWKATFFGSFDAANFITVDKPPAALWVMDISARLFGVNSWAILVPEALEGVAAVGLLYLTVRRWFGSVAGLIAGAVLALTPAAALMFRFNNPDALLTLLLIGAAYCLVRAVEDGRTRWLVLASTLIGFAFLTKLLAAFVVVPIFAVVYLLAAPTPMRRRLVQLVAAGSTLVVASLWWVVAVQLMPSTSRPYIGGSQDNSLWNVIFGYNGFGRLTGNETGSVVGGGASARGSPWGITGLTRMFNADFGGQASWLIPAALILLAVGLAVTGRAPRTDRTRVALLVWGGWLVVSAAVFSFGQGIIHPYYTVVLAPAVGALVGIGGVTLWPRRSGWAGRAGISAAVAATAIWAFVLLKRTPHWNPWLAPTVLGVGLILAALLLIRPHLPRRLSLAIVTGALVVGLLGPAGYTVATVATAQAGAIPSAGPNAGRGPGGGPGGGAFRGGIPRRFGRFPTQPPAGGSFGRFFPGAAPGAPASPLGGARPGAGPLFGGPLFGGPAGGLGGLLNGSTPSAALTSLLKHGSTGYTWVAATVGANTAAGYQLATGSPVMAIGGFNGTDPAPTVAQFQHDVATGKIHYFIAGGGGFGARTGAGSDVASQITTWVERNFTSQTVGSVVLYDLAP